jgi:hypothetical protein
LAHERESVSLFDRARSIVPLVREKVQRSIFMSDEGTSSRDESKFIRTRPVAALAHL